MQIGSVHWRQKLNCVPSGDTLTSHLKATLKCLSLSAYARVLFGYMAAQDVPGLVFSQWTFLLLNFSKGSPLFMCFLSSRGWVLARDKENITEKGWRIQEAFYYKPLCCSLDVLCASSACNILKNKPVLPLRNDKYKNYVFGTQRPLSSTAGRECSAHHSRTANHARICIMSSGASVCSWINLWMALYGSVMNRRADYTRQMMHA